MTTETSSSRSQPSGTEHSPSNVDATHSEPELPGPSNSSAPAAAVPEEQTASDDVRSNGGRWLTALKTIVGLESPTLRDTLEDALKSGGDNDAAFTNQEREMLLRLLQYNELRVEDVMVPRADIIAIDHNEPVGHVMQSFVEAGVSRLPLFNDSLDDPRGIIHIKDVVKWLTEAAAVEAAERPEPVADIEQVSGPQTVTSSEPEREASAAPTPRSADTGTSGRNRFPSLDLSNVNLDSPISDLKISRRVMFVPPSMPAMNLLLRMQSTRTHMALVVDEYGGTDGLVTIEDLIEEIVGQIEDEHDEDEETNIIRDPRLGLIASARTPIEELEKLIGLELALDDDDDVDTLGGLVFALSGSVPVRGEIIQHPRGIEFEVLEADPRRIKRLRIIETDPDAASDSSEARAAAPNGAK